MGSVNREEAADSLGLASALHGGAAFGVGGGVGMWPLRARMGTSLFRLGKGRVTALKAPLSSAEGGREARPERQAHARSPLS